MAGWGDLERELDAWGRAGETATLWWRDDDAATATPALRQLIDLAPLPMALAVIPARADASLVQLVRDAPQVTILQHGYAHANHADPGVKKAEYPVGRDIAAALRELHQGARRLAELFGARALPVLVPPWNRIDPWLAERLGDIGILGLSTYGPRVSVTAGTATALMNTHIDIMRWHGSRGFLGTEHCLDLAVNHLAARRQHRVDSSEPTGLLTHHLVHDADAWQFLSGFTQRTRGHPAVQWTDAARLIGCGPSPIA
jgi:hypothetical protein